jgi:formate dehydrogenase major subunit
MLSRWSNRRTEMNNKQLRLNIDGKEVLALPGQTILEVAEENEIFIPTLCFDERTRIYGSCGLCLCEVEGSPKLAKACATPVTPNMVIKTNSERIRQSRKTNLELLLSNHKGDCRPPCVIACPAHTDCQGYVGLIANGEYEEALKLVKDKIPLPASLGRVCPHPCEDECRRGMIDEAISIQMLKRFVADNDLSGEDGDKFIPECPEDSGRTVGIIGSGPHGAFGGLLPQAVRSPGDHPRGHAQGRRYAEIRDTRIQTAEGGPGCRNRDHRSYGSEDKDWHTHRGGCFI